MKPPDNEHSPDTTTIAANKDYEEDEETATISVYDPVNFPTTTISPAAPELDTTALSLPFLAVKNSFDEDHIRFPPNTTAEKNEVEPEPEALSVKFYNKLSNLLICKVMLSFHLFSVTIVAAVSFLYSKSAGLRRTDTTRSPLKCDM